MVETKKRRGRKPGGVTPALEQKAETAAKKNPGRVWSKKLENRRVVKVTPVFAAHLLEKNTLNRDISQGLVDKYARDMKAGNWKLNGETIKFDWNSVLRDGQHRLWACLQAGVDVDFEFAENLDPAVMDTIDTGRSRSYGDVLKIHGGVYSAETSATLRWWYMYDRRIMSNRGGISHSELREVEEAHPELQALIPEALKYSRARRLLGPGIWCFVYSGLFRANAEKATSFAEQLDSGEGLKRGAPALALREKMVANTLAKAKISRIMVAAFAVKAANAHLYGQDLRVLKWLNGEGFPEFSKKADRRAKKNAE
jgi:hypothetical protein